MSAAGAYRLTVARNRGYRLSVLLPLESPEGDLSYPRSQVAPVESFSRDTVRNFLDFPPLPVTVTLSGRVTAPSGPLADALVTATANGLPGAPDISFRAATRTDADGNYVLPVLSGADYALRFSGRLPVFGTTSGTLHESRVGISLAGGPDSPPRAPPRKRPWETCYYR